MFTLTGSSGFAQEAKKQNPVPTVLQTERFFVSEAESKNVVYGGIVRTPTGKRVKVSLNGQAYYVAELKVKYAEAYLTTTIYEGRIRQDIDNR